MAKRENAKIVRSPLEKAESQIKLCAMLAYLSAIVAVIFSVLAITGSSTLVFITAEAPPITIAKGVIIGLLGFGVSKKSRACAIALLAIFCLDLIKQLTYGVDISSILISILIWGYAYICGVQGAFAYKKLKDEEALWLTGTDA